MSTNRAADEQGLQAEFLKHGIWFLESNIVDLLNQVVCSSFAPSKTQNIIHPIQKSSSFDQNNYRIIMVGHTFSKLYAIVLHQWLSEELERHDLRARGQVGFHPNYQMIDHIFTLQAIIEEARHHSFNVYIVEFCTLGGVPHVFLLS
jgi:hypothetical protein